MTTLTTIAMAFTLNAQAAFAPVPDTMRTRSDGWERDMLFVVDDEAGVGSGYVRFAVTGCAQARGYVGIIEIDNEQQAEPLMTEWAADDDRYASTLAGIICEGA